MAGSNLVQSLLRGTEIVDAVANSEEGLTLNQISQQVGLKTTTVYNLLRTFCATGWLERDAEGRYFIGPGLLSAVRAGNGGAVLSQTVPVMLELAEKFPLGTMTFSEFTGEGIWCRLRMSPDKPGIVQRRLLQQFKPYTSATGLMFQAFMAPDEFAPISDLYPFPDYGLGYWNSQSDLEDFLAVSRNKGYVVTDFSTRCTLAMALPVSGGADENEVKYALGMSIPNDESMKIEYILENMRTAINKISMVI